MDNENILEDFFRALRISLTTASSYSKDHPYFIKSVENFMAKIEETLVVINPLSIGVTSSGLVAGGKNLTKSGLYDELAALLHQRKVKSIEIRSGVTLPELVQFLSVISLPRKDVFKGGGINLILKSSPLTHFTIDELDYSAFLHVQGQECGDIWGYMLKDAAHSKDIQKLEALADGFGPLIKRSSQKDILESEDVPSSIGEFLISLKEKNKEKFDRCSREVFLWLLNNKTSLNEADLEKLKPVFKSLDQDDFSSLLWEGIAQEEKFDDLSLQLFSKISEQKDSQSLVERFLSNRNQQRLKENPGAVKRVQNLLTGSQGDKLSPVYRNILESLVKGISATGVSFFDQKTLRQNYHYIVLNLLSLDEEQDNLEVASAALEKELPAILEDNDYVFLKDLYSLLARRKKEGIRVCLELEKKLSVFIEDAALNQSLPADQNFLLEMVSSPAHNVNYYLDKIFSSEKPNPQLLGLFFRLFPDQADIFYRHLEKKLQDMDFLSGLIDSLSSCQGAFSLSVLEYIYSSANELVKCEVLKGMLKFKKANTDFILRQLSAASFLLRKNLIAVLLPDAQGIQTALEMLFKIPSPWGSKNNLLIENIQIVADLKITGSTEWLRTLVARRFFWNSSLRRKAQQVLGEWNEL